MQSLKLGLDHDGIDVGDHVEIRSDYYTSKP